MRQKVKLLALTAILGGLVTANAFSQTAPEDPTQLGSRQIEVRTLDVNYDTAYRSATQALLSIGYAISHSDKTSGILTGTRAVGVTEMKGQIKKTKEEMTQYQEQVEKENTARSVLGFVPYVGWLAWLFSRRKPPGEKDEKSRGAGLGSNHDRPSLGHDPKRSDDRIRPTAGCKRAGNSAGSEFFGS